MSPKDLNGESTSNAHDNWINLDGSDGSVSETPAQEGGTGGEGNASSGSGGTPQPASPGGGVNTATILLVGLMLITIAGAAVLANRGKKTDSPEEEEIILEPEVVILDKGSAVLTASYSTEHEDFFDASGEDEIQLTIVANSDRENLYDVDGSTKSVQNVTTYGLDQGIRCPMKIQHIMEYIVSGSLNSANCRFFITVTLKPEQSEMLQNSCSFDLPGDVSLFYAAPRTDEMQFITQLEKVKSETFTFYLSDVKLPKGVNCPSFVR
jgi:preprotein translocase subunit SecG